MFYFEQKKILKTEVSSWTNSGNADCAVVLTGSKGRIQKGIDLLWQKRVKKVIISGVYKDSSLIDILPRLSEYVGIDKNDIILEKYSQTTFGNAIQSLALVEAFRCQSIFLVTSRLHMYRAHTIFKQHFPEEISITKYAVHSSSYPQKFWPVFVEVIKSLFYSIWAY